MWPFIFVIQKSVFFLFNNGCYQKCFYEDCAMNIKLILRITCINFVLSRIACQFITRVIAIKLLHVRTLYPSTKELAIQI